MTKTDELTKHIPELLALAEKMPGKDALTRATMLWALASAYREAVALSISNSCADPAPAENVPHVKARTGRACARAGAGGQG